MPTQDPKKMLKDLAAELLKVNKELDKTKDGAGSGKKRGAKELETGALTTILDSLSRSLDLVKTMLEKGNEENCPRVKASEDKTRTLEDQNDSLHQKSLKGKFLITSLRERNVLVSEEKLREEGKSPQRYVTELIYNKLGVSIKEDEIASAHHTKTGLIVFRLKDFKHGSSYDQVVKAIKSGQGKDVKDLFVNFALTPRRAALLYEARQLKKANKISKFLSDSDGSITVVKTDGGKLKLTNNNEAAGVNEMNHGAKEGTRWSPGKTLTREELLQRLVLAN